MKTSIVILLILIFLSIPSYSGTIDPKNKDSEYIKYAKDFTYVGKLVGKFKNGNDFIASCVAIDDHNILTAAHFVSEIESCNVIINNKTLKIDNPIIAHHDFNKDFGIADIAIAYTSEKIGLDFYPELYKENNESGKICCICGFGTTGNFNTGNIISDGNKRAGSNIVDGIQEDLLICSPSRENSPDRTRLEFLISNGDSGGGLFIDGKLAGINSCVISSDKEPDSSYSDESGHTKVSKFYEWIKKNTKK